MVQAPLKKIRALIKSGKIYKYPKYKKWRRKVFRRDGYCCQFKTCTRKGGYLEAHHIIKKAMRPDLVFVIDNGVTLCKKHHRIVTGQENKYIEYFFKIILQKRQDADVRQKNSPR